MPSNRASAKRGRKSNAILAAGRWFTLPLHNAAPADGPFVAVTGSTVNISVVAFSTGVLLGTDTVVSANPTATAAVPEPLTLSLFRAGLDGAFAMRRKKKAA